MLPGLGKDTLWVATRIATASSFLTPCFLPRLASGLCDNRRLEGQPDTCEVSQTISRMLLAVNSFLSLSKDNAPGDAYARRLGAIAIVGLSRFQGSALTERMKSYGVGSGVGGGVGVGVGAGATYRAASIAVGPSSWARPEAFSKLTSEARHEMVPPLVF